jgi:hypothetical protein
MAVGGFHVSPAAMAGVILAATVFLPKVMVKANLESWYTDTFANPIASFIIIMLIGIALFSRRFWGHKFFFLLSLIPVGMMAYLYVWALYL